MALVLKDRVKETTTTTGTGTYTLAGAVTGFEAFSSVGDGNTTYYSCTDGTDFEVGIGTYTASGTTLARTTILQSSNSDSAVSWSSGTKTIFCAQPAEKAVFLDASGNFNVTPATVTVSDSTANTNFPVVFHDESNGLLDDTGALRYNPSTGELLAPKINVSGTDLFVSRNVDVDGTLEADAMTLNGTAITATATLDTGISNNNVPKFTSGVADDDFLRVDGTAIEGRSASEVLSDIAAMPLAGGAFTGDVTFTGDNYNIVFDKSDDALEFADNAVASFGDGADLKIFHDGNKSVIQDAGTGQLLLRTSKLDVKNPDSSAVMLQATAAGAVELYHNNAKKLETTSGGISVTGEVAATSLDISGDVDVDGTLEADAITVNGTALNTVIADEATALAIALG